KVAAKKTAPKKAPAKKVAPKQPAAAAPAPKPAASPPPVLTDGDRAETRETFEPVQVKDRASSLVPATERQINVWSGDADVGLKHGLKIGQTYWLNFRVGPPVSNSLTSGAAAAVSSRDVPKGGLPTDWLVVSRGAELSAGTGDTDVRVAPSGGV